MTGRATQDKKNMKHSLSNDIKQYTEREREMERDDGEKETQVQTRRDFSMRISQLTRNSYSRNEGSRIED